MALWLPLGLFILWRYYAHKTNVGDLTPERQAVYSMAISFEKDPASSVWEPFHWHRNCR